MKKSVLKILATAFLIVALCAPCVHAKTNVATNSKEAILIVAFGTSVEKARSSYANVEKQVKSAFPGQEIRWAWTAHSLLRSGGKDMLSPQEALARLATEGIKDVSVLSLHVIPGAEYNNIVRYAAAFEGLPKGLERILLAPPLLYDTDSMQVVAKTLVKNLPKERKPGDAVLFVGHGTHHPAGVYYPALQYYISTLDKNTFIGTVEGDLDLEHATAAMKAQGIKKVWLAPLMTVAGDHALNDLFGDEADSWKQHLAQNGFAVETVRKGLGDYPDLISLWVNGLRNLRESKKQ
jgi:Cobalamin biosynthesis protein CbiK, Co2+ chelatase